MASSAFEGRNIDSANYFGREREMWRYVCCETKMIKKFLITTRPPNDDEGKQLNVCFLTEDNIKLQLIGKEWRISCMSA